MHQLPETIEASEVLQLIDRLNKRDDIDGILVQLPLPSGLPTDTILEAVLPEKDVDGLHTQNMGRLLSGKKGLRPCTPRGIMALLERYKVPIEGKSAVVIGRSNLVGKPVSIMLLEKHATVKSVTAGPEIWTSKQEMPTFLWLRSGAKKW